MADTCIVCLGDLATSDPPNAPVISSTDDGDPLGPQRTSAPPLVDDATIAHLLPCKHNLHNTCLKPWVERANSCPICRTDFNMVELKATIDGPCIESYAVQDKKQTAEFDPSDFLLPDDILDLRAAYDDDAARGECLVCGQARDYEDLLLCDGCNATTHTYCCGLTSVPSGAWFCEFCQEDGTADSHNASGHSTSTRPRHQQRSRALRRAARGRQGHSDYTRVWQTVLARTNIDLDFPFEDDAGPSVEALAHRREMNEWTRRFQAAERQGGFARFRETAGALMGPHATVAPTPETVEETRVWNAFDRVRDPPEQTSGASTPRGRKRKSATASPAEPQESAESERRLKRPRTRRVQDPAASSRAPAPAQPLSAESPTAAPVVSESLALGQRPSFLRQLLTEVQNSSTPTDQDRALRDLISTHTPRNASPGPASPTYSPANSNHPSPRLRSASPHSPHSSRPTSPSPGLTSRIEPIFVRRYPAAFSPVSPGHRVDDRSVSPTSRGSLAPGLRGIRGFARLRVDRWRPAAPHCLVARSPSLCRRIRSYTHTSTRSNGRVPRPRQRHKSPITSGSDDERPSRELERKRMSVADDASPTRGSDLSYDDKSRVQEMVSAALKPLYRSKALDTEQYTKINMNVSRMMYDKIAQAGGLESSHNSWAGVALTEVESAVKSLRESANAATTNAV